jgi:heme A synthase
LFLVLPVVFFSGIVSIVYPSPSCYPIVCLGIIRFHPVPGPIALFSLFLGVVGILLGFLAVKLSLKSRKGVPLGLAFSMGSIALLYGVVTLDIQNTFITTPAIFLVFPEVSIIAMTGATVLFSYELARKWREVIEADTS